MKKGLPVIQLSLTVLLMLALHYNSQAQIIPNNGSVPSVSHVPPLPQANLGGKINYVRTWQPWKPITDPAQVPVQAAADVKTATGYVDGLGRLVQTVSKQASPNGNDMVAYKQFDKYGRETIQPLPYTSTTTDGAFKPNPYAEQQYYYATGAVNNNQYTGEQIYFGRTALETSPLGRPDTVMAAGNSWAGSLRGIRYQYQTNTAADAVRIWTVADAAGSIPLTSTIYAEGQLYKQVVTDEHGNSVVEYKDKQGQVVLKKVQKDAVPDPAHTGWLCTYYIYDDYGLLRCVIQPEAVKNLPLTGWQLTATQLAEQCFRYEYDARDRMIIKKVPGAGEVWMVYDARDRVVMVQDANMRNSSPAQWLYTTYDGANRPVSTGKLNSTADRATHQAAAYNSTAYPVLASYTYEQLTSTVYDYLENTNFDNQDVNKLLAGTNTWAEPVVNSGLVYGKPLFSTVKTDGLSEPTQTTTYYDDKGRLIQTQTLDGRKRTNTITNRYDFSNKPIASYHRQYIPDNVEGGSLMVTLLTRMEYDAGGRLLRTFKNIDDEPVEKLVSETSYDELSQLKTKKLAPAWNSGAGLETLQFEYNIRGWLKAMNKAYVNGSSNSNWFGQVLSYDHGFTNQQHNGNISGLQWRSKGDGEQRAYGFAYDRVNRLTTADFTQYTSSAWNTSAGMDFTANNLAYDANGNILAMNQKGWKLGGSVLIDELSYTYETGSNKLKQVLDGVNNYGSKLGDFKYDATTKTATDYTYDANGNLVQDNNKAIKDDNHNGIVYNHLNLPVLIRVKDKGTIEYRYDANGAKVQKITTEGDLKTVTSYIAGFVYQFRTTDRVEEGIDTLQYISQEEGRIRPAGTGFVYDYFVKDHLGNVRLVLTEEQKQDIYPAATLESTTHNGGTALSVEDDYYTINSGQVVPKATATGIPDYENQNNSGIPVNNNPYSNVTANSQHLYKINGNDANKTGLGITLKVMAGDTIDVFGKSYYFQANTGGNSGTNSQLILEILNGLLGGPMGGAAANAHGGVTAADLNNLPGTTGGINTLLNQQNDQWQTDPPPPSAYINYVFFDEQFKYVSGGFSQATGQNQLKSHALQNLQAQKSGYVYIYVSNVSTIDVFFDNLQVTHIRGAEINEDHYYPFGLIQAGISYKALNFGNPESKNKYNGIERNNDFDLNIYDAQFRQLDGQIGRWWQIDPKIEKMEMWSPYASNYNNPVLYSDPLGDEPQGCCPGGTSVVVAPSGGGSISLPKIPSTLAKRLPLVQYAIAVDNMADRAKDIFEHPENYPNTGLGKKLLKQKVESEKAAAEGAAMVMDFIDLLGEVGTILKAETGNDTDAGGAQGAQNGVIYEVPGTDTKSGKPYIGRTKNSDPAQRRSDGGRDRKKAKVVDTYDSKNVQEGRIKEQKKIDEKGLENLDNKRNEIKPKKGST